MFTLTLFFVSRYSVITDDKCMTDYLKSDYLKSVIYMVKSIRVELFESICMICVVFTLLYPIDGHYSSSYFLFNLAYLTQSNLKFTSSCPKMQCFFIVSSPHITPPPIPQISLLILAHFASSIGLSSIVPSLNYLLSH